MKSVRKKGGEKEGLGFCMKSVRKGGGGGGRRKVLASV